MKRRYLYLFFLLLPTLSILAQHTSLLAMPAAAQTDAEEEESTDISEDAALPSAASSTQEESFEGPDTIDLPEEQVGIQGNWVKKKDWLTKSYELRNEVNAIVVEVQGSRKIFNEKYAAIDRELDIFYKELGLDQGKLQELFDGLARYLDKKKKHSIDALKTQEETDDDKVRDRETVVKIDLLEEQINFYKTQLAQLKLDMKSIEDLDKSITDRLKKLDDQMATAIKEASQAEEITRTLWQIIDHKKARDQYFHLKGNVLEKLQSIDNYLKNDLLQDFDRVSRTIKTQISKAHQSIKQLEAKGFIIQDRSRRVEVLKLKELQDLEKTAKEETQTKKAPRPKVKKSETWYSKIYDFFVDTFARVINFFTKAFSKIFGVTPAVPVRKLQPAVPTLLDDLPQPLAPQLFPQTIPVQLPPQPLMPAQPPAPALHRGGMPKARP